MADDLFADIPESHQDLFADVPKARRRGVSAALADIRKSAPGSEVRNGKGKVVYTRPERSGLQVATDRAVDSMTFGLAPGMFGSIGAGGTDLRNLVPGLKVPYSGADYMTAFRINEKAERDKDRARHPVASFTGDVAGALTAPGAKTAAKFVVGKAAPALAAAGKKIPALTRLGQTARASGVAAAQTGVTEANLAAPGHELEAGGRGALTAAIATPALGALSGVTAKAAPVVLNAGKKVVAPITERLDLLTPKGQAMVTPKGADITSAEKLASVLRREGLTPDAVTAVVEEWGKTGGVTPAVIDILKDAGASPAVMRLLQRSGATAPIRAAAEKNAETVVDGVQEKALTEARALPTAEPRTPTQIRADLDARTKAIEEEALAARSEPPAGDPKESSSSAFHKDLNAKYDASRKGYQDAYDAAMKAKPEDAWVEEEAVLPLFGRLRAATESFNPDLKGVKSVLGYLDKLDQRAEGVALSVRDLEFAKQKFNEIISDNEGAPSAVLAGRLKGEIDAAMDDLAESGRISGDPEIVDKWRTAILGYKQHQDRFGSGLAEKLTKRGPKGETVVEPWRAGDVIFGSAQEGSRPLNTVLSELEAAIKVADPASVEGLKRELYGRLKPEELAALMRSTGGRELLPKDLVDASLAAQEGNLAAEAAAEAAKVPVDAERAALELGEAALTKAAEEFAPGVEALDETLAPVAASGSRQAVVDHLESPDPASVGRIRSLLSSRARENLGALHGEDAALSLQARLRNMERQGQNARDIASVAGGDAPPGSMLDDISPWNVASPYGRAAALLDRLRRREHLTPEEYSEALRLLTGDAGGIDAVTSRLIKRYPGAKRAVSPALGFGGAEKDKDVDSLERLKAEYGL